jgi:hypothetical protein
MPVSITTIQPQDSIAGSRLTINSNFGALKAAVDSVTNLLDPSTYILSGVKSATIDNSAVSFTNTIFSVGKGSSLLGNVIMGTIGLGTSVLINGTGGVTLSEASLTLTIGNITLSDASSLLSAGGHLSLSNELRLPGVSTAFSNLTVLSSTTTTNIPVANLKYLVIKNDDQAQGLTASLSIGTPGQVLEIYHILGASAYPVYLDVTNFYGLTGQIELTQTGDTLKCVYDGASWYLWNYSASSFATTVGPTGSSVVVTYL